jgi:hypothetical protein
MDDLVPIIVVILLYGLLVFALQLADAEIVHYALPLLGQ